MKNYQNSSLFILALAILTLFACKKDPVVTIEPQPEVAEYMETVIPSNISDLYESRGDINADTVWVFLQGGPTPERGYSLEAEEEGNFPFFHDDLRVYPYQAQHINTTLATASDFTFEDAKVEDAKSIEMITSVINNFKSQNKVVYVIGHSFGAFLAQELVAVNGGDIAEKVLILNGRLNMDEAVWQGFSKGETWLFDEKGLNPTFASDNAGSQQEQNMSMLAAGLGNNRYTQRLANIDLSKVIFISAEFDAAVGRFNEEEINFATENAEFGVILPEFGHSDVFDPAIMEVLQQRMIQSEETVTPPTTDATVQSLLVQAAGSFISGGAVAGVLKSDGTMDIGVIGNSENNTPITSAMSMGIGSNTKTFTAALIFKLVESGSLQLTDKLSDILPSVVNENISGDITIQQLLTHSSGIYDPLNSDDGIIEGVFENPSKAYSLTEYLALVKAPVFAPGTKHSYSNTNYILLGAIIEKQAGTTYQDYLRTTILDPLNLSNTFMMGYETPTNEVAYSWFQGNSLKDFDRAGIESLAWTAGSIFSTVEDMTTWYQALFSGQVINETSLATMLTTYEAEEGLMGAGIFETDYNGNKLYFHTGETIAYNSIAIFNQTTGDVIVSIVNQTENDATQIGFGLLDNLLQ